MCDVGISSWAWCCRTLEKYERYHEKSPSVLGHSMLQSTEKYEKYHEKWTCVPLGPDVAEHSKSTKGTTKNHHQFLGRMLQSTEKYEKYQEKWTSVLGPDVAEHPKVRKLPGKMNISSRAGCCRTPKSTKITRKNEHQFLGRMLQNTEKYENYQEKLNISSWAGCCRTPKSTKITRKNEHQFLGRMLQRQKRQKSTSFIVKSPFKTIAEHRKVRELPRKMNMEEVDDPKEYENLQTKPVLDPFKSTAPHRKVRELPRNMNIEEVEEPETMKIYRQNPRASARPPRKLRKFTDETNMQARNHENSDEICAQPVRHLDLATPAFYYYRKNPKCYHTVWGIRPLFRKSLAKLESSTDAACPQITTVVNVFFSFRKRFAWDHIPPPQCRNVV